MSKKKIVTVVLLCVITLICIDSTALAAGGFIGKAENAKTNVVQALQDLAKIAAVVFIVWAGYIFAGAGGDPNKKAAAKDKLLYFFIAVFFITGAQDIVDTVWVWFS